LIEIVRVRDKWVVCIPHNSPIFQVTHSGVPTYRLESDVLQWIQETIGDKVRRIAEDVSEDFPWDHRPWQLNTSHAFFFHTKKQARMFILRWT
jgi:hypothetical protein